MARSRGVDMQTVLVIAGLGALVYFMSTKTQGQTKPPSGAPPKPAYMPPLNFGLNDPTTWDDV